MEKRVQELRRSEIRAAAQLLARAFADDPFIGYFMSDARRRRVALPAFFASVLHELIDSQAVFASERDGRLAGVAAWLPPQPAQPSSAARRRAKLASLRVRLVFPGAAPMLPSGFESLADHHPPDAHWYLAFIGIDPHLQRHGLGRALLEPILSRADRDRHRCYLETPFTDTRAFYRRLGFDDTAELHPVDGAPTIWTMTRQPQPA